MTSYSSAEFYAQVLKDGRSRVGLKCTVSTKVLSSHRLNYSHQWTPKLCEEGYLAKTITQAVSNAAFSNVGPKAVSVLNKLHASWDFRSSYSADESATGLGSVCRKRNHGFSVTFGFSY